MAYKEYRIIVAGGRDFFQPKHTFLLRDTLDLLLGGIDPDKLQIVSGAAPGADTLGEEYAEFHELSIRTFPANWDKYGKSAGFKRNQEMADYANHAIVFWDGKSTGSKDMIDRARVMKLYLEIIEYGGKKCQF